MSSVRQTIQAVTDRANELAGDRDDESAHKLTYDQMATLIAAFSVDEDLRITFNFLVMRGRASVEERNATAGMAGKDEKH